MPFQYESAKPHDLGRVLELLRGERLPEHGVVDQFGHYLVVRDLGQVLGACGSWEVREGCPSSAVLMKRSVAA